MNHSHLNLNMTLPAFPFTKLSSDLVREARALYDAAVEAQEAAGAIGVEQRESLDALQEAHRALEAQRLELERDIDAELELADGVRRRELLADPHSYQRRFDKAASVTHYAIERYRAFVYANAPALLAEIEPDAVAAAQKLADAYAKLAPLREARGAVEVRVAALTNCLHNGNVDGVTRWALNQTETEAPLPQPWAVAQLVVCLANS